MNKTAYTEQYRLFVLERLPDPLTPASAHIQIFDNYIAGTRMRIRNVRDPYSNIWTRTLQQRFVAGDGGSATPKLAEMHLNDAEHRLFDTFHSSEVRKNRYFHEFDNVTWLFDAFLGALSGLVTARIDFHDVEKMIEYEPPAFAVFDVTANHLFHGAELASFSFTDLEPEIRKLTAIRPVTTDFDE